jgi:hypothetical protein
VVGVVHSLKRTSGILHQHPDALLLLLLLLPLSLALAVAVAVAVAVAGRCLVVARGLVLYEEREGQKPAGQQRVWKAKKTASTYHTPGGRRR